MLSVLLKPLFGYVPDRDNHFDEFTGRRNLDIHARLWGMGVSDARREIAHYALDAGGARARADRRAASRPVR